MAISHPAAATCSATKTPIRMLANSYPAWKVVSRAMSECGSLQSDLDSDLHTKQAAAFASSPSSYHIGGVSNSTFVPLLEDGLLQPLDAFIAPHGHTLNPNQIITVNGEAMAIAMLANIQHLVFRRDLFTQLGLSVPKTYEDLLHAAQIIEDSDTIPYPLGGTYQAGWHLALEFINLFLAYHGQFFAQDGTLNINSNEGMASLNMMKRLSAYMDPEFLIADPTYVQQQFQQGNVAMAVLWTSRVSSIDNPDESVVHGKIATAAAPTVRDGGKPAATLWWDGFVIARNISDDEAQEAFRLIMAGLDPMVIQKNNDVALWLSPGYQAPPLMEGAVATISQEAPAFPASRRLNILHQVLGNHLPDFFTGQASAETTLRDLETSYRQAAKEAGF